MRVGEIEDFIVDFFVMRNMDELTTIKNLRDAIEKYNSKNKVMLAGLAEDIKDLIKPTDVKKAS